MQRRQPPSRTESQSSEKTSTNRREQRKKRRKARTGARSGSGATNPLVCFFAGLIIITIIVLVLGVGVAVGVVGSNYYSDRRKARSLRKFEADNAVITPTDNVFPPPFPVVSAQSTTTSLSKDVLDMCANTLWHTLKTTTIVLPNDESFIHTGDIDDLWLRDSAGQVHPLLLPWFSGGALVAQDTRLARVVSGLIRRSAFYIRHVRHVVFGKQWPRSFAVRIYTLSWSEQEISIRQLQLLHLSHTRVPSSSNNSLNNHRTLMPMRSE